jgi:hypothetical protein
MRLFQRLFVAALLLVGAIAAVPVIVAPFPPPTIPGVVIPLNQIFTYNLSNPNSLLGEVSLVWSPSSGVTEGQAPIPGVPSFFYMTAQRNNFGYNNLQCTGCVSGGTNPKWDWFLAHHPDWIRYQNDQLTPAWEANDTNYVPINVANPAVVSFIETGAGSGGATQNLLGALNATYAGAAYMGVAIDNASYENGYGSVGYFQGAVPGAGCTETAPSCGGTWVQQFPPGSPTTAPALAAWQAVSYAYYSQLHQWINGQGKQAWCNFEKPSGPVLVAGIQGAELCSDIVLGEDWMMDSTSFGGCQDGVTPGFTPYDFWISLFQYAQTISTQISTAYVDYICDGTTPDTIAPAVVAWGISNFLLVRNAISYYSVTAPSAATYTGYPSYFFPPCGTAAWNQTPLTPAKLNSGNSYERILNVMGTDPAGSDVCYVEVNPNDVVSGTTTTFTLPAGTWQDQFGNSLSTGVNTLQPASGIVAVKVG